MAPESVSVLPDAVKLLPSFDVDRLLADLSAVEKHFTSHENRAETDSEESELGGWEFLPLRCPGGDPDEVGEGVAGKEDYADSPYLELTPYVREILDSLDVPARGVRFSALAGGAMVPEHTDQPYGLPIGWVRLHVPVITNDRAILFVNGEANRWKPGEFWYANFGMPHSLSNESTQTRVHLIIDCYISENLFKLFPSQMRKNIEEKEVVFYGEEQSLPQEMSHLSGTIRLPPSFLNRFPEQPTKSDWRARGQANIEAELSVQDGRLVVQVAGHETALAHLGNGEFRPLCWTRERTMTFGTQAGAISVLFRCRRGSTVLETTRKQPLLRAAMPSVS